MTKFLRLIDLHEEKSVVDSTNIAVFNLLNRIVSFGLIAQSVTFAALFGKIVRYTEKTVYFTKQRDQVVYFTKHSIGAIIGVVNLLLNAFCQIGYTSSHRVGLFLIIFKIYYAFMILQFNFIIKSY